MRVAFQHTDEDHPDHGVCAYSQGRVQDFNHPITGEQITADDIMVAFLDRARKDYPAADGYEVWPERLVLEAGLEDCYVCVGAGQIADPCPTCHSSGEDPEKDPENPKVVKCPTCNGKQWAEGTARVCPNCHGAKQTPYGEWRKIDEGALRERAAGKAVDVPEIEDLPVHQIGVAAEQEQLAAQDHAHTNATTGGQ